MYFISSWNVDFRITDLILFPFLLIRDVDIAIAKRLKSRIDTKIKNFACVPDCLFRSLLWKALENISHEKFRWIFVPKIVLLRTKSMNDQAVEKYKYQSINFSFKNRSMWMFVLLSWNWMLIGFYLIRYSKKRKNGKLQ